MNFNLFITIFITGLTLAVDAFAVSVTDGMVYSNLTKGKGVLIPLTFGIFQALMPIIGFYISFGLSHIEFIQKVDHWIALVLLCVIGGKMIAEGLKELKSPAETLNRKGFSFGEVLVQGVATSIDALAVGFTFTVMLQSVSDIGFWAWISVLIIGVTTFCISLAGLIIGVNVGKLFKKNSGIASILGGVVLIAIGIKIVIESCV